MFDMQMLAGADSMTMTVLIYGGPHAGLETPMLLLKNADKNYLIRALPDDVQCVAYRMGLKAWMDKRIFLQWLKGKRVLQLLPDGGKRVLYVDNVNTHDLTEEVKAALREIYTEIRFFPCNATHFVQLVDSFAIQELKTYWRNECDDYKMNALDKKMWADGMSTSGKQSNIGKRYFLQLATKSFRAIRAQRDTDGVSYARKAMLRCGMALNLNGKWEQMQLLFELQGIIRNY